MILRDSYQVFDWCQQQHNEKERKQRAGEKRKQSRKIRGFE